MSKKLKLSENEYFDREWEPFDKDSFRQSDDSDSDYEQMCSFDEVCRNRGWLSAKCHKCSVSHVIDIPKEIKEEFCLYYNRAYENMFPKNVPCLLKKKYIHASDFEEQNIHVGIEWLEFERNKFFNHGYLRIISTPNSLVQCKNNVYKIEEFQMRARGIFMQGMSTKAKEGIIKFPNSLEELAALALVNSSQILNLHPQKASELLTGIVRPIMFLVDVRTNEGNFEFERKLVTFQEIIFYVYLRNSHLLGKKPLPCIFKDVQWEEILLEDFRLSCYCHDGYINKNCICNDYLDFRYNLSRICMACNMLNHKRLKYKDQSDFNGHLSFCSLFNDKKDREEETEKILASMNK